MSQVRPVAQKLVLAAVLGLLLAGPAFAGTTRTEVLVGDDWPIDSILAPGTISCPGGELEGPPVAPMCPGSGRIHFRGGMGYGCDVGKVVGGGDEPRFTGVVLFVFNGNLDAEYTGSVWGTWRLVPGPCNRARLDDPEAPFWKGTWRGQRVLVCDGGENCVWIGKLKLVGKGHGGDLEGLHFKGIETIRTFTPLPVPWELLFPSCGPDPGDPPCGPEGVITGTIKE